MLTTYPKIIRHVNKGMLLAVFLLFSFTLNAQSSDTPETDTTKILTDIDSATAVTENVETREVSEETVEEEPPIYFSPKAWSANEDPKPLPPVRKIADNRRKEWKNDGAFWYADLAFEKKEQKKQRSGSITYHPIFQTILWLVIILGFAAFVVIYLSNSNAGIFRKSKAITTEKEDEETEDIFAINYNREIDKAVAAGNHRLAVRLLFLRQLRGLADKKLIEYKSDRTNLDYLLQLQPTKWYGDFFRLTRNYEYSWYGLFEIDKEKFALIKKEFDEFNQKLN